MLCTEWEIGMKPPIPFPSKLYICSCLCRDIVFEEEKKAEEKEKKEKSNHFLPFRVYSASAAGDDFPPILHFWR